MHILIAEDEAKTRTYLAKGLAESGFTVDCAADGRVAMQLVDEHVYDALILDVMLPALDGWSVVQRMRQGGNHTPVLFLTARDRVEDRVKGLELGGDDYLVKPFAFSELLARLRSILRRRQPAQPEVLRVADLTIDPARHRAERAGAALRLTPKEFAVLALLARNPGRVFVRTEIAESVWGVDFDTRTNVVDVVIRRLRLKVDRPFGAPLIHTVRGTGYVLEQS
ncbi:MAG TPA: heavy metal response regulator transcription factor [Steroidobacteraceae bacterium]|nr:heavy metal response regulator transcription factor [Steroidobacteraceae bacterium]